MCNTYVFIVLYQPSYTEIGQKQFAIIPRKLYQNKTTFFKKLLSGKLRTRLFAFGAYGLDQINFKIFNKCTYIFSSTLFQSTTNY